MPGTLWLQIHAAFVLIEALTVTFERSTAQRIHTHLLDLSNLASHSKPTIWLHVCECDGREGAAPVCVCVRAHAWMRWPPDLTPQEGHAPLDIL